MKRKSHTKIIVAIIGAISLIASAVIGGILTSTVPTFKDSIQYNVSLNGDVKVATVSELQNMLNQVTVQLSEAEAKGSELQIKLDSSDSDKDRQITDLQKTNTNLEAQKENITSERDGLIAERDKLIEERDSLTSQNNDNIVKIKELEKEIQVYIDRGHEPPPPGIEKKMLETVEGEGTKLLLVSNSNELIDNYDNTYTNALYFGQDNEWNNGLREFRVLLKGDQLEKYFSFKGTAYISKNENRDGESTIRISINDVVQKVITLSRSSDPVPFDIDLTQTKVGDKLSIALVMNSNWLPSIYLGDCYFQP